MADNAGNVPATPRYISIELSAIAKILLKIAVSENPAKMAQEEAIGVLSMERGRFAELDAAYDRSIHGMERSAARQADYRNKMKQKASQGNSASQQPSAEKKTHDAFRPPLVDDVVQFAIASNLRKDSANEFCDYYESKGWKVGNVKMKDWKAAVRKWENSEYDNKRKQAQPIEYKEELPY